MTIGSRQFKNGKYHGILEFDSGKKVILNAKDWNDLECRLLDIEYTGRLKEKYNFVKDGSTSNIFSVTTKEV